MRGLSACEQPRWLGAQDRRRRDDHARAHTPAFEAKAALAAIKGEKTLAEPAQRYGVHVNQITTWKPQLFDGAAGVFDAEARPDPNTPPIDLKALHAEIGESTLTNDFSAGARVKADLPSAKR